MWWNFLNNLDKLIIWGLIVILIGVVFTIGVITIIKWVVGLF